MPGLGGVGMGNTDLHLGGFIRWRGMKSVEGLAFEGRRC